MEHQAKAISNLMFKNERINQKKNLNRIKSASGYGRRDKNKTLKSKDVIGVMLRDNQKEKEIIKPQIQK